MVTLTVHHLPNWMTSASLKKLCARYGKVLSAYVITDRSRTSGLVEMASEEGAAFLISDLNGSDLYGSSLTVTRTTIRIFTPSPST